MRRHVWSEGDIPFITSIPQSEILMVKCENCGLERWERDGWGHYGTWVRLVKYIREGVEKQDWRLSHSARVPPCRSNEEDIDAIPLHRKELIEQMAHELRNALVPSQYFLEKLLQDASLEQREFGNKAKEGIVRTLEFVDKAIKSL